MVPITQQDVDNMLRSKVGIFIFPKNSIFEGGITFFGKTHFGSGSTFGEKCVFHNSVFGEGCSFGSNCYFGMASKFLGKVRFIANSYKTCVM